MMSNPTVYRLVNKSSDRIMQFRRTTDVFWYLANRRLDNFLVIKSDEKGDRLVMLTADNFEEFSAQLKQA